MYANTTGHNNTATGFQALLGSLGSGNLALGSRAGSNLTTGSDNVDIANAGKAGESGAIRIGTAGKPMTAFLAGVSGNAIPGSAQPVLVNAKGQLGTASAARAAGASAIDNLRAGDRRQDEAIETLTRKLEWLRRGDR